MRDIRLGDTVAVSGFGGLYAGELMILGLKWSKERVRSEGVVGSRKSKKLTYTVRPASRLRPAKTETITVTPEMVAAALDALNNAPDTRIVEVLARAAR
jgi:hypothetical protein